MASFSKRHSRCPKEHFKEEKLREKKLFLNCPFRFLNKNTRTFPEIFLADFEKSVLGVQRNSLWTAVSQKKLWNQNFLRNFLTNLGLLLNNFRPICHDCILSVEQLLGKIIILEYNFDWWLFWTLNSSCHGFGETFYANFKKLLSTCPKEKRLCCPTFQGKVLFLNPFVIFKEWTDSQPNLISYFYLNFGKGLKAAF